MPVRVELSKQHLLIQLGTAHLWNRKTSCPKNELAPTTISSCLTQSLSSEHRFWSQAPRPLKLPLSSPLPRRTQDQHVRMSTKTEAEGVVRTSLFSRHQGALLHCTSLQEEAQPSMVLEGGWSLGRR